MKKGQVVLFVVIILTVMLIIVTSVVNRTLISVKNTTINTDSSRAFNAAEAGIEELLNRSDLSTFAGSGEVADITSLDPSNFSERKYSAVYSNLGYFETKDEAVKDTAFMIEFNASTPPQNLRVNFVNPACVLISAIGTNGSASRYFVCGENRANFSGETVSASGCAAGYDGCTAAGLIDFGSATPYALIVKVLNASSRIRVTVDNEANYNASFKTKNITGTAWAVTRGGVKKQIEVQTKTTKDVYPVFDYALYLR